MSKTPKLLFFVLSVFIGCVGCAAPVTAPASATPDLANIIRQAGNAETSVINVSPAAPCCRKQTLPEFLGVKCVIDGAVGLVNRIRNRLGMAFPGLEAKPAVLAITDPANMAADSPPAVKAAAEIKSQEDQAAQKVKALRYLASIGCGGCYPDVEEALIAAMEDCTEVVRYEAVKAVRETTGKCCVYCSCEACCSEKIQNKLRELACENQKDKPCCPIEPSARVRRQARMALAECGPPVVVVRPEDPEEIAPPETPTEGPAAPPSEDLEGPREAGREAVSPRTLTSRRAEGIMVATAPTPAASGIESGSTSFRNSIRAGWPTSQRPDPFVARLPPVYVR